MQHNKDNIRKTDIILVLDVIDNKKSKASTGMVDPRLFSGGNRLHIKMDPQVSLWFFEYDNGILPLALKQRFTSFSKALEFSKRYFLNRNIMIKEIID